MRRLLQAAALALLAWPAFVSACSCRSYFDPEAVRKQRHVFVFRIVSLQSAPSHYVTGTIEIVDPFRGEAPGFRTIRYNNNSLCCGIRVAPDEYYVAFTSQSGPNLFLHQGNLMAAPLDYDRDAERFRATLRGLLETGALDEKWIERTRTRIDVWPSPCPPPRGGRATPPPGSRTPAPATSTPRPQS